MKRLFALMLALSLLSGCAFLGSRSYTAVTPHDEGYEIAIDSDALTVSNYLSLKNAILRLVERGETEGVIRAEAYSSDLAEDLNSAVYEVSRGDPLGAFAVDYMSYDYSKIVGYYEIQIHTTYRRSLEEIQSVISVAGADGVRQRLKSAMENYEPELRLRIGDYREIDIETMVEEIFYQNPQFALELPTLDLTAYPDSGSSRVLEIQFHYRRSQNALLAERTEMETTVAELADLYGSDNNQMICAERLLKRLIRETQLVSDTDGLSNSVYGVLCQNRANAYGCCQAYLQLLREREVDCTLATGSYGGKPHTWCLLTIDGQEYFADPVLAVANGTTVGSILPRAQMEEMDYQLSAT